MSLSQTATKSDRKRVLVPLYSQSGQLAEIVASITAPLRQCADVEVIELPIKPVKPYPFPWPFFQFLDAFPESIQQRAPAIATLQLPESVDLILLPYQVWYLSPSLPVQALLQSEQFKKLAHNRPVITIIGCRNMWHLAQEKVKYSLQQMGAHLLDNVVLTDQGSTLASFITVPRWMWTGKKNAFLGLPAAGVAPEEIQRAARFGRALVDALREDKEKEAGPLLWGLGAVTAEPTLLISERAGTRSFALWSRLVRLAGGPGAALRKPLLLLYICFLTLLILTVVPVSLILQSLLRPAMRNKLRQQKIDFERPSGSGIERLSQYE